jgi:hypothetical protein
VKQRTAARLAWSIGVLTLVGFVVAVALGLSRPSPPTDPRAALPQGIEAFDPLMLLEDAPFLVFTGLGVLIAARRPRNPIGWMFITTGFLVIFSLFATEYALYALYTNPGSLPGGAAVAWASAWVWVLGLGLVAMLILILPSGRLASRRWRPLAWFIAADTAVLLIAAAVLLWPDRGLRLLTELETGTVSPVAERIVVIGIPLLFGSFLPASASMFLRFRRARGEERQQLKWVAYGVGVLVASVVFSEWIEGLIGVRSGSLISLLVGAVGILGVPVATGIAVLRYRLYDIDVIINRTLVYGAVTALLALVYVAGVVGVGGLLRDLTDGESNDIAVAASTLAVAGLFRPARARIQGFIDRRFYRRKYDAARTVESFSARIREEVDLEALSGTLLAVVGSTMQPRHVSLWLRN